MAKKTVGEYAWHQKSSSWEKSQWIEAKYSSQLRQIAKEGYRIVDSFDATTFEGRARMEAALNKYADILEPWAEKQARDIFDKLNRQDLSMWALQSRAIGSGLKRLIERTDTGTMAQAFIHDQVALIKSLPIEAGDMAQSYALEAMQKGERPESILIRIKNLGDITANRAKLIARTEISKAASILTQTRAINAGATQAIWRTSKDVIVREAHRHMEGVVYSLLDAPILEDGTKTFPGQIYNCRCHPEIIIPESMLD